ncbi:MAG: quinone-dependent dihydroorotate dehydrogenase [Myxococcota bacterium]|nr:quinone-dependent dihydroorotate dehydrogenase [Myxococcota bacterium]
MARDEAIVRRGCMLSYRGLRSLLFLLPPDAAHAVAFAALAPLEHVRPLRALAERLLAARPRRRDERLVVRRMGLEFESPLGLAAGFDKNAKRPHSLAALGFDHLELGTVTARAQAANPRPNLFRLPDDRALVNRLGFPNDGAQRIAARLRRVRREVGVPIGMSIGKSRVIPAEDLDGVITDYLGSLRSVRDVADFVVVNVSSPNTAGLRQMQARAHATALLGAIAAAGEGIPLLVKIAPDLDDGEIEELLAVVEAVGFSGVVATNTTVARGGLTTTAGRIAAVGPGGLSGPPLRDRALAVVRRVRARLGPERVVIGVGGIESADHAIAFVRAGADLVQMYTGFVYGGPGAPSRIRRELSALVAREGAQSIMDLVGADLKT